MTSSISGASFTDSGTELELAGFDLGEVEHLVDEAEQVVAGAVHALERLLRFFGAEARRMADHHLGQSDDGVERGAQLVAHAGEELRLVLARLSSWRLLSWISSNSRTFSIAITAWSAKVVASSICLSVNGRTRRRVSEQNADRSSLAQQRHAEHGADIRPISERRPTYIPGPPEHPRYERSCLRAGPDRSHVPRSAYRTSALHVCLVTSAREPVARRGVVSSVTFAAPDGGRCPPRTAAPPIRRAYRAPSADRRSSG